MSAPDRGTGALVLAALYLEPTAEREAELRRAAAAGVDWEAARVALEAHGILGLARANLVRARANVPAGARRQLDERAAAMRALELGFRLTLERFLLAAERERVEVTLLKGASLSADLYPERGLRSQSDLDLLVRPADVPRALAAARRIGLVQPPRALAAWWYRRAHFHLKLEPLDGLQREIELHWHLHPSAQLYTVRLEDLLARRRPLELAGTRAWTLDPLDRLLHLVTHLVRHCPLGMLERETLHEWAADPRVPLRLKWLLDVRSEIELRSHELGERALARRAAEWNAESELALVLAWLRDRLGFAGAARERVEEVLAALPRAGSAAPFVPARDRPLAGLDLRRSALLAFPRWVWPPASYFGRLAGNGPAPVARRAAHAAGVLARAALVLAATPLAGLEAFVARKFTLPRTAGLRPEELLDLATRARELARAQDGPAPM
jgi:hypothetical protein